MTDTFRPDLTQSWAWPAVTTPQQPTNQMLPTWGGVGAPDLFGAKFNPNAPVSLARKAVGYAGLGGLGDATYGYAEFRAAHPTAALIYGAIGLGVSVACGYHGYKRHRESPAWAIGGVM